MNTRILILLFFAVCTHSVFAQNGVRIAAATGTADASAMLDVVATNKGFLLPRMTAAQRAAIATPATGLLVYQTDGAQGLYYYTGPTGSPANTWVQLSAGALSGAGTANYVAKWTSASAIGNSQIFDNGTNVGLNAGTSPSAKLSIGLSDVQLGGSAASTTFRTYSGALGTTAGNTIKLASIGFASSNQTSLGIEALRRTNGTDWTTSGVVLKLDVDATSPVNSSLIALSSTGNIGIGSTNPGYKLDVAGDINFSSTLKMSGVNVIHQNSADVYANIRVIRNESTTNTDGMYIGYGNTGTTNGHLRFYANGTTERMVISASNGSVRINNLAGTGTRPVYVDASGILTSNGRQYTSNGTLSANYTTGQQVMITTANFAVVSGELLKLNANIELRNVSGSGNDRWRVILQVNPCGGGWSELSRTITATPYNNHGTFNYYPYVDMWSASCTGNVQFRFLGERFDSNDSWNWRNIRILITKE